jgi:hypothetical protein
MVLSTSGPLHLLFLVPKHPPTGHINVSSIVTCWEDCPSPFPSPLPLVPTLFSV